MYQSDFKAFPAGKNKKRTQRRYDTLESDDDAPRFFDTQNKLEYLNWAGKNFVPSMKPHERSAITHAQFDATSTYKGDFEGRRAAKTPIYVREPSIVKFGCASSLMRTSYNNDFSSKKQEGPEINCKPAHQEATTCKRFKGSTEYNRQYIKTRKESHDNNETPTLEQLQALIIDL